MSPSSEKKSKVELIDVVMIVGVALVTAGAGWIYRPAAPLLLGSILVFFAWVMSKDRSS